MKLNLSLKEPHIATIDYLKEKYSITSDEEVITKFIKLALELNKIIFNIFSLALIISWIYF